VHDGGGDVGPQPIPEQQVQDRRLGGRRRKEGEGDREPGVAAVVGELPGPPAAEHGARDGRQHPQLDGDEAAQPRVHDQVADRLPALSPQPQREQRDRHRERDARCDQQRAALQAEAPGDQAGDRQGDHERPPPPALRARMHEEGEQAVEDGHQGILGGSPSSVAAASPPRRTA
jgi:hypothetical protein